MEFAYVDGGGRVGIIASVSRPFCLSCNRIRLTADGKLRNCLFALEETDIKTLLRQEAPVTRLFSEPSGKACSTNGKGTKSTRPASSSRCGPCTPSAAKLGFGL